MDRRPYLDEYEHVAERSWVYNTRPDDAELCLTCQVTSYGSVFYGIAYYSSKYDNFAYEEGLTAFEHILCWLPVIGPKEVRHEKQD